MGFRFEQFADAPAAQAAFEAAFPIGSPADPALQALVGMGAQCKSTGPGKVACRYVEHVEDPGALAGWCWHVAIDADSEKAIKGTRIALAILAI
ncbi:MAG TPA: hypothetical protein VNU96_21975 [Burkholderiales bacterium]|jgi:hypothetical protein|nr:hypothetical protein [Burkholderiales bacterium]